VVFKACFRVKDEVGLAHVLEHAVPCDSGVFTHCFGFTEIPVLRGGVKARFGVLDEILSASKEGLVEGLTLFSTSLRHSMLLAAIEDFRRLVDSHDGEMVISSGEIMTLWELEEQLYNQSPEIVNVVNALVDDPSDLTRRASFLAKAVNNLNVFSTFTRIIPSKPFGEIVYRVHYTWD